MLLLKWLKRMQPAEIFRKFKRLLPWRSLTVVLVVAVVIAVVKLSEPVLWPGGVGLGKGESVATKTVETVAKNAQGQTTKTVETTKIDDGKTLWDWLSVLGVPLSLAILGYWLQQAQQKRAEKLAEEQRELAADETKEEVLQVYFDRLSALLVDKNLLAIAAKGDRGTTSEERELLDSAVDVIRARTLSILRRFEKDPERKISVIRFLIEADIVSKLKLNLSYANLRGAFLFEANLSGAHLSGAFLFESDLSGADLSGADLSRADLRDADLSGAKLSGADLRDARLRGANLRDADLSGAKLSGADSGAHLRGAFLRGADLSGADLSGADLFEAELSRADLSGAKLSDANLSDARLSGAKLSDADLRDAHLCDAHLRGAKLRGAKLSDADLSGADLSRADLSGADLSSADLSSADLSSADLSGAKLFDADLSGANGTTVDQLQYAKLCQTELPPGIPLNPNRDCKELGMPEN